MNVYVNGETLERPDGETLAALLLSVGASQGRVAVMVNEEVILATERATRRLAAGDRVEILTFAGGG